MKKTLFTLFYTLCLLGITEAQNFKKEYVGVWANDHSELLQTDSVFLFFERLENGTLSSTLIVPSRNINLTTSFNNDSTISTCSAKPLFESINANGTLTIGKQTLKKVEALTFVKPYDMPKADNKETIGNRLQEWRLGVYIDYNPQSGTCYLEANTNHHMFIYANLDKIKYYRTAKASNVSKGTLFHQNIRMMKNENTKEFTRFMSHENLSIVSAPLSVNESRFIPNSCYFDPNGGIYWPYVSHTADQITLNGCGETYYIQRKKKDYPLLEWIKFKDDNHPEN